MGKRRVIRFACAVVGLLHVGCAGGVPVPAVPPGTNDVVRVVSDVAGITFGEPRAVAVDFQGNLLVADGMPGRIVRVDALGVRATEFQRPASSPGFYPADLRVSGFFVYAVDEVGRTLLRFDKDGAYRDQLVNFDNLFEGTPVSPVGLDVDSSGRIAVSDARNHRVILFNSFLDIELIFGSYGSFPGQFNAPQGVVFTRDGDLLVADSGNGRVQLLDSVGRFIRTYPAEGEPNPMRKPRRARTDEDGNVVVADPVAGKVFVFDPEGRLLRAFAPAGAGQFAPTDAISASGLYYVTDGASGALMVLR